MQNLTKREKRTIIKKSLQDIYSIVEEYKYEVAEMKDVDIFKHLSKISYHIKNAIEFYEKEKHIF